MKLKDQWHFTHGFVIEKNLRILESRELIRNMIKERSAVDSVVLPGAGKAGFGKAPVGSWIKRLGRLQSFWMMRRHMIR